MGQQASQSQPPRASVERLKESNDLFGLAERRVVNTTKSPEAFGPYSQAIGMENVTFVSGQVGINPTTKEFAKPKDGETEVEAQTRQALKNMGNILFEDGAAMDDVIKTTVLLTDMDDFEKMNQAYAKFFPVHPPARACYAVKELPKKARVEIEGIAAKKQLKPGPGTADTPGHPEIPIERELIPIVSEGSAGDDGDSIPVFVMGEKENAIGGVIVIQEWWGVTPTILSQARHIAAQGFYVVVPDLYKGTLGVTAEEGHHMMSHLDFQAAVKELTYVGKEMQKRLNGKKIGVVGFCMGGALSAASATNSPDVFACGITFYGSPPKELADVENNLKVPLQGHFGLCDDMKGFSDPSAAEALEKAGKDKVEMYLYKNVGHAFMNSSPMDIARKEVLGQIGGDTGAIHDPDAIRAAWGRLFTFFKKHLEVQN